jgi:hypothetical protein
MVNYNISLIWIKAIWGKFPLFTMIPGFGCSEVIIIIIIRCYRVCLRSKWPHRMGSTLDRTHDDAMVTKIDQTCFLTLLEHVGTHRSLRSQVHNLSVCCRTRMNKVSILDETPNLKSVPSKSTPFSDHSPVGFSTPIRRTRHHQSIACSQNPTCNPGDAGIPWDSMGFHGIPRNDPGMIRLLVWKLREQNVASHLALWFRTGVSSWPMATWGCFPIEKTYESTYWSRGQQQSKRPARSMFVLTYDGTVWYC